MSNTTTNWFIWLIALTWWGFRIGQQERKKNLAYLNLHSTWKYDSDRYSCHKVFLSQK